MRHLLLGLTLLLAACGSGLSGEITVTEVWVRPTPPGVDNAAIYLNVVNGLDSEDAIVGATSPSCGYMEIHTQEINEGIMEMGQVSELPVSSGETLVLEPNRTHLMCLELVGTLESGDTPVLTVEFKSSPPVSVQVQVRNEN